MLPEVSSDLPFSLVQSNVAICAVSRTIVNSISIIHSIVHGNQYELNVPVRGPLHPPIESDSQECEEAAVDFRLDVSSIY